MKKRTIGEWIVTGGTEDAGRNVWAEDGYCWRAKVVGSVTAAHVRGKIYIHTEFFADEAEADRYVAGLPGDFNASEHTDFDYWRTAYGSDDWGSKDELSLMDDEELENALKRGFPS